MTAEVLALTGSGPEAHDHVWYLQAITHEDGRATEEYACTGCGNATFR
jgi:hypothetical protein